MAKMSESSPFVRVFRCYSTDFTRLLGVAAIVLVPARCIQLVVDLVLDRRSTQAYPDGVIAWLEHAPIGVLAPAHAGASSTANLADTAHFAASLLVWWLAWTLVGGAAIYIATARLQGSQASPVAALRWVIERLRPALSGRIRYIGQGWLGYAVASLLASLGTIAFLFLSLAAKSVLGPSGTASLGWVSRLVLVIGFLVGPVIYGVIRAGRSSLTLPLILVEGVRPSVAGMRSRWLTRHRGRLAAGVLALPWSLVLAGDVALAVAGPLVLGGHPGMTARVIGYLVPGFVLTAVIYPLGGVAQAVLYAEAVARSEPTQTLVEDAGPPIATTEPAWS